MSFLNINRVTKNPPNGVAIAVEIFAINISCVGLPLYMKHIAVVITMQTRLPHLMKFDSSRVGLSIPAASNTIPL